MTKVKGKKDGKIITAHFDGKEKSYFPSLKKTKSLVVLNANESNRFYGSGSFLAAIIAEVIKVGSKTTFLIAENNTNNVGESYFNEQLEHFLAPFKMSVSLFNEQYSNTSLSQKVSIINNMALINKINFEIIMEVDWIKQAQKLFINNYEDLVNFYKSNSTDIITTQLEIEESLRIVWLAAAANYNFIVWAGNVPKYFIATRDCFIKKLDNKSDSKLLINTEDSRLIANILEVNFKRTDKALTINKAEYHNYNFFNQLASRLLQEKQDEKSMSDENEKLISVITGIARGIFESPLSQEKKIDLLASIMEAFCKKKPIENSNSFSNI